MTGPALRAVTNAEGMTHLVTDAQMAAGRPHGRYVGVCGDPVLAGSLLTPDSDHCRRCRRWRAGGVTR